MDYARDVEAGLSVVELKPRNGLDRGRLVRMFSNAGDCKAMRADRPESLEQS